MTCFGKIISFLIFRYFHMTRASADLDLPRYDSGEERVYVSFSPDDQFLKGQDMVTGDSKHIGSIRRFPLGFPGKP